MRAMAPFSTGSADGESSTATGVEPPPRVFLAAHDDEAVPQRYADERILRATESDHLRIPIAPEPVVLNEEAVRVPRPARPVPRTALDRNAASLLPDFRNPEYPLRSFGGDIQRKLLQASKEEVLRWHQRIRHLPHGVAPGLAVAHKNAILFDPDATEFPTCDSILERAFLIWQWRTMRPHFHATDGLVGARLQRNWRAWRDRGYPPYIWEHLRDGFNPNLTRPNVVPPRPRSLPPALIRDPDEISKVALEFDRLESVGVVEFIEDPSTGSRKLFSRQPGFDDNPWGAPDPTTGAPQRFVTSILAVLKKSGAVRVCYNGKPLNAHVSRRKRKFPMLRQFCAAFRAGFYYATMDLKDWYCQLPLSVFAKKLFYVLVPVPDHPGRFWLARYLCVIFGYAESGDWAQDTVTAILQRFRRVTGAFAGGQQDDIAVGAVTRRDCYLVYQWLLDELHALGVMVHPPKPGKTTPIPHTIIYHLGRVLSSVTLCVYASRGDFRKIKRKAARCLGSAEKGRLPPLREMQSLTGSLNWETTANAMARLAMHRLRHCIAEQLKGWHARDVPPPKALARDLHFMCRKLWGWNGKSLLPAEPHVVTATDACDYGTGVAVLTPNAEGPRAVAYRRLLSAARRLEVIIDEKEAEAVVADLKGLIIFNNWRNINVLELIDNQVVLSYLLKQGGRHRRLAGPIVEFLWWAQEERHIFFLATYISTEDNFISDTESRRRFAAPQLNPEVFRTIVDAKFGPVDLDAMASAENAQVQRYVAWKPDPMAMAVDVFRQDLRRFSRPYFNPPHPLIPRVLRLIKLQRLKRVVVVAPAWDTRVWWSMFAEMIVELPVILPRLQAHVWAVDDRTTDSKARPPPTRPWLTIAACCSGMPADAKAFRKRLRTRCSGPTSAVTKTAMARRITECCPYGHDIADKTHVCAMSILNTLTLCVACAGSGMGPRSRSGPRKGQRARCGHCRS